METACAELCGKGAITSLQTSRRGPAAQQERNIRRLSSRHSLTPRHLTLPRSSYSPRLETGPSPVATLLTPFSELHGIPPSSPILPHASPRAARKKGPPVISPVVYSPYGASDMMSTLFRNRIIFIGSPVDSQVAQDVISKLVTLVTISPDEDIKLYINCPGGSTYSVMAVYDAMAWVKADISTVAFGMAAAQGALLLAAGTKGKRFAMPNTRIMIHQPQGGSGGNLEEVQRQANELQESRNKLDQMLATFTGQPFEEVQRYTDRDHFFSASEALDFGLIDGILETEY